MSESTMPNAQDLVLGGEMPSPVSGAVLGGLLGLQQRFQQSELAQKLAALEAAATYGAEAIPLLRQGLEDANLSVRSTAYSQLRKLGVSSLDLERGIPLRVGDRIYGAYRSAISYGDDLYYISACLSDWYHEEYPFYRTGTDTAGNMFKYVSDAFQKDQLNRKEANYEPTLIAYFTDRKAAETKAEAIYLDKFGQLDCDIWSIDQRHKPFDLRAWTMANEIVIEEVLEDWGDSDWAYQARVLVSLHNQKRFDLLREIWQQLGYKPLAFVHKYVINRPCYLRMVALET